MAQTLIGNETWSNNIKRGQVFLATHDGEGNPLSVSQKSFISFSWGGRSIEEFDLIAVINSNRMTKTMSPPFEDITSNYEVLDGQYYWRSHYQPSNINFLLATDGIREDKLQQFIHYFIPGKIRKLVLAESPNRVSYARVSAPPSFSLLPFEERITQRIGNRDYIASTTLWRGEVSLSFVMDDPFWYGEREVLSFDNTTLTEEDLVKIYIEDGIPFSDNFKVSCLIGNNKKIVKNDNTITMSNQNVITDIESYKTALSTLDLTKFILSDYTEEEESTEGTEETIENGEGTEGAEEVEEETENDVKYLLFYYPGTAPGKPNITFALLPTFDSNTGYVNFPRNLYSAKPEESPYNFIQVGKNKFAFTTPNILTSYNQALSIISGYKTNDSIIDIENNLRNAISDYYIRGWACGLCKQFKDGTIKDDGNNDLVDENTSGVKEGFFNSFRQKLKEIFVYKPNQQDDEENNVSNEPLEQSQSILDSNQDILPFYFTFDSETGTSKVYFYINKFRNPKIEDIVEANQSEEENSTNTIITTSAYENENAGDMVRSNYLMIEDRNIPGENGEINEDNCLKIFTDANLLDFSLDCSYTYL